MRSSTATPSVVPRAMSGSAISESTLEPWIFPARAGTAAVHRSKSGSPLPLSTARPVRSARAGGEYGG
ncbi:hypothetical protein GXP74_22550 [Streptacidiphilus sp. P02-A3a]|nr:hypothetical protein GXP74_22550 [Streptacidiphilus sp. P02-A3a]